MTIRQQDLKRRWPGVFLAERPIGLLQVFPVFAGPTRQDTSVENPWGAHADLGVAIDGRVPDDGGGDERKDRHATQLQKHRSNVVLHVDEQLEQLRRRLITGFGRCAVESQRQPEPTQPTAATPYAE